MSKRIIVMGLVILLLTACTTKNAIEDIPQEHTTQPLVDEASHFFDPYNLQVGDQVNGWTVSDIIDNYFNAPAGFSILTKFDGEAEVSGTFEYYYNDANYNPGDVIFRLDEQSLPQVPIPVLYSDRKTTQFILLFDNDEDKALFGPPGTTGNATIKILDYHTLMAEAYGGVIDNAKFEHLINIETIPPDSPDKINVNHMRDVVYFNQLELTPEDLSDADVSIIYDWLVELSKTFNQGLQMDERRITEEQRADFRPWLQQVFTSSLAETLLEQNVPQVEGGYIVAGFLDIIPPIGPHTADKHQLTQDGSTYTYSVQLSGGANIVTLHCVLVYKDSQWKIEHYSHKW